MEIKVSGNTHTGLIRKNNEDAYAIFPDLNLYIIADGLGGHAGGEVASRLAVDVIGAEMAGASANEEILETMQRAIKSANSLIQLQAEDDSSLHGMGTTVVVVAISEDKAVIAHVGDSRAYLIRKDIIMQITKDHTVVEEYIRIGIMTHKDALYHPSRRVLSRAVGTEGVANADFESIRIEAGDVLLLCTDGLTNMLSDKQILQAVSELRPDAESITNRLIELANDNGGIDNITVITLCALS
ncbi:MAG: Stp1/IreP family PP2C-type Ser/Thr phosphatase [Nitrospirae bacterium]|nr:Stp1/IreP family PP2C-type Ser/Thr phosphatase [Nitrospirota bacterium]